MPAPYARRDWQTRADRALGRMGRGSQQGRFPGTRPVPPSSLSRPGTVDYRDFGQLHKVDHWSVSDDSIATFSTTHEPMEDSWNLELNGVRVHYNEFSVAGRTVTITDPADLFLGADDQSTPWALEMQYDYLIPGIEIAAEDVYHSSASSPLDMDFGSDAEDSSVIVMAVTSGGTHTFTGRGSWTLITTHTYQSRTTKIYIGFDFGSTGTQINLGTSSGAAAIGYLFDKGTVHATIPSYTLGTWQDTFAGDGSTNAVSTSSGQSVAAFCAGPLSPSGLVGRIDSGITLGTSTLEEGNVGTFLAAAAGDSTGGSVSTVFDLNPYGGVGVHAVVLAVSV